MCFLKHFVFAIMTMTCACSLGGVVQSVQNFDSLSHGQIVSDQFYDDGSDTGFQVFGKNFHDGRELIVAFDTRKDDTRDPDLEAPFEDGNLIVDGKNQDFNGNAIDFNAALIIQEGPRKRFDGGRPNGDGTFLETPNDADDEGRRDPGGAGSITFDFNRPISSFGIDLLDVEGVTEAFSFVFSSNGVEVATVEFKEFISSPVFVQTEHEVDFGDNSANRIVPITAKKLTDFTETTIASFDQVTVNLGGSGALDNIRYTQAVPEPTSLAVWLGAMFAFVGCFNRRRSVTS